MNWVTAARSRFHSETENQRQKEFFGRQKHTGKKMKELNGAIPTVKDSRKTISQDLISIHTMAKTHGAPKPVVEVDYKRLPRQTTYIDLDKSTPVYRKDQNLDLGPVFPDNLSKPSRIANTYSSEFECIPQKLRDSAKWLKPNSSPELRTPQERSRPKFVSESDLTVPSYHSSGINNFHNLFEISESEHETPFPIPVKKMEPRVSFDRPKSVSSDIIWNHNIFNKLQQPSMEPVTKHRPVWEMDTPDLLGLKQNNFLSNVDNLQVANSRNVIKDRNYRDDDTECLGILNKDYIHDLRMFKGSPEHQHRIKRQSALAPEDFQLTPLKKYRPLEDQHHLRNVAVHKKQDRHLKQGINVKRHNKMPPLEKEYQKMMNNSSAYEPETPYTYNLPYDNKYDRVGLQEDEYNDVLRNESSPLHQRHNFPSHDKWNLPSASNIGIFREIDTRENSLRGTYSSRSESQPNELRLSCDKRGNDTFEDFDIDLLDQDSRQPRSEEARGRHPAASKWDLENHDVSHHHQENVQFNQGSPNMQATISGNYRRPSPSTDLRGVGGISSPLSELLPVATSTPAYGTPEYQTPNNNHILWRNFIFGDVRKRKMAFSDSDVSTPLPRNGVVTSPDQYIKQCDKESNKSQEENMPNNKQDNGHEIIDDKITVNLLPKIVKEIPTTSTPSVSSSCHSSAQEVRQGPLAVPTATPRTLVVQCINSRDFNTSPGTTNESEILVSHKCQQPADNQLLMFDVSHTSMNTTVASVLEQCLEFVSQEEDTVNEEIETGSLKKVHYIRADQINTIPKEDCFTYDPTNTSLCVSTESPAESSFKEDAQFTKSKAVVTKQKQEDLVHTAASSHENLMVDEKTATDRINTINCSTYCEAASHLSAIAFSGHKPPCCEIGIQCSISYSIVSEPNITQFTQTFTPERVNQHTQTDLLYSPCNCIKEVDSKGNYNTSNQKSPPRGCGSKEIVCDSLKTNEYKTEKNKQCLLESEIKEGQTDRKVLPADTLVAMMDLNHQGIVDSPPKTDAMIFQHQNTLVKNMTQSTITVTAEKDMVEPHDKERDDKVVDENLCKPSKTDVSDKNQNESQCTATNKDEVARSNHVDKCLKTLENHEKPVLKLPFLSALDVTVPFEETVVEMECTAVVETKCTADDIEIPNGTYTDMDEQSCSSSQKDDCLLRYSYVEQSKKPEDVEFAGSWRESTQSDEDTVSLISLEKDDDSISYSPIENSICLSNDDPLPTSTDQEHLSMGILSHNQKGSIVKTLNPCLGDQMQIFYSTEKYDISKPINHNRHISSLVAKCKVILSTECGIPNGTSSKLDASSLPTAESPTKIQNDTGKRYNDITETSTAIDSSGDEPKSTSLKINDMATVVESNGKGVGSTHHVEKESQESADSKQDDADTGCHPVVYSPDEPSLPYANEESDVQYTADGSQTQPSANRCLKQKSGKFVPPIKFDGPAYP